MLLWHFIYASYILFAILVFYKLVSNILFAQTIPHESPFYRYFCERRPVSIKEQFLETEIDLGESKSGALQHPQGPWVLLCLHSASSDGKSPAWLPATLGWLL